MTARSKRRLDVAVVEAGLAESRERARRLILAGAVRVDGQRVTKPGQVVSADAAFELEAAPRYVSRGGEKLDAALRQWQPPVAGAVCLDLGSSTGGFTDCLLQHGARRVYAVDVGRGQLHWRLRNDPRVVLREGVNARYLTADEIGERVAFITADVSFISLQKVLPAAVALLAAPGWGVFLVKPQFEAGVADVVRGVVRDPAVHRRVIEEARGFVRGELAASWDDVMPSPLLGPAGNREFLLAARWERVPERLMGAGGSAPVVHGVEERERG